MIALKKKSNFPQKNDSKSGFSRCKFVLMNLISTNKFPVKMLCFAYLKMYVSVIFREAQLTD